MNFRAMASQYRQELLERVMPFWMRHSLDQEQGGFFSCLDRDGSLYDSRKYVWMIGRQVWMLAKLYNEVERRPDWLEAATLGMRFLDKHATRADGQVLFSLTRDGAPSFLQRKPYAAVFLALAMNEYGRAVGDAAYHSQAKRLFAQVRHWIRHPEELGRPSHGGKPMSQLADIYVIALLAGELGEPEWIRPCLDQLDAHIDVERGGIFRENALVAADSPEARLFCPGSVFEAGWILLGQTRDTVYREKILSAIASAHDRGWDQEHGGYFYFMDVEGKPPMQLEWPMKLWWVHVEALNAFATAYQATRDAVWLQRLEMAHEYTWARFPDRKYGEWFAYLDRRGDPTHLLKGGPYKCCFHVPRALLLCSNIFDTLASC